MIILGLWAFTTPKSEVEKVSEEDLKLRKFREKIINWSTSVIKITANMQVFCLAFFSLQIISSSFNLRLQPAADYGKSTDSSFYKIF
jgi:hypothetical protein